METNQTGGESVALKDTSADVLQELTSELKRLNGHRFIKVQNSTWRLVVFQLLRGMAFGLGSVIGATFLLSILVWWLAQFATVPVIGEWISQLVEQIKQDIPQR